MKRILSIAVALMFVVTVVGYQQVDAKTLADTAYKGKAVVNVNKGNPKFTKVQKKQKKVYAKYSKWDKYGRCHKVTAVLSKNTLAKGKRGSIGMYKPSGWPKKISTSKYSFIPGKYLWNRSHLLGYQLYGNSTNNKYNLITGTRQMNAGKTSMLTYENKVANYLKSHKKNHVVYRVTPYYRGKEKIARGVQMEAWSVEDEGKLRFNVYVHNVQSGVKINYYNGLSSAVKQKTSSKSTPKNTGETIYYINTSTKKFHVKNCRHSSSKNVEQTNYTYNYLVKNGYSPCKTCAPK